MKLLVDGVFFQLASTGIARVWSSLLPILAKNRDLDILLLDRGNAPRIDGIESMAFPAYTATTTAADSLLIDEVCHDRGIDLFVSTYYTTPATIPSVLMVYDMIPEVMGFDLTERMWREKQLAISFASRFACISDNTRQDLKKFYPAIPDEHAMVTHCGLDRSVFHPRSAAEIAVVQQRLSLGRPYFLLVGSRHQHQGYKNAALMFEAVRNVSDADYEIICVGGESVLDPEMLAACPANLSVRRLDLTDDELACAYSGALALVYPSLYEGFGMPVIEAMACGCPVITTRRGALGEVAGDAALFISGTDAGDLRSALTRVQDPAVRSALVDKGLRQVQPFDWATMAASFHDLLKQADAERDTPAMRKFFAEWKRLRTLQAEVDVSL